MANHEPMKLDVHTHTHTYTNALKVVGMVGNCGLWLLTGCTGLDDVLPLSASHRTGDGNGHPLAIVNLPPTPQN